MAIECIPKYDGNGLDWPPIIGRRRNIGAQVGMWRSATGYGTVARGDIGPYKTWHRLLEGREMGDGTV